MNNLTKVLLGTINVAARHDGRPYIGAGLPLCDSNGTEWKDMSPRERWSLCLEHLQKQDSDFDELLRQEPEMNGEQQPAKFILFGIDRAMRLSGAVQDSSIDEVMDLACIQSSNDMDAAIGSLFNQGDSLWDTLFEQKLIITESPK